MLHFLPPRDLKRRADAIRLGLGVLAERAGLDATNLYRVVRSNQQMRTDNAIKLTEALIAEERKLFDHLAGLHPDWVSQAARASSLGAAA